MINNSNKPFNEKENGLKKIIKPKELDFKYLLKKQKALIRKEFPFENNFYKLFNNFKEIRNIVSSFSNYNLQQKNFKRNEEIDEETYKFSGEEDEEIDLCNLSQYKKNKKNDYFNEDIENI